MKTDMEAELMRREPRMAQAGQPNLTGIPTQMKLELERHSGLSFDDVRVHYNSDKPARLQALAYTQGTQVYMGPGQERYLPHELGHVVQQKRGLVRPTRFLNGVALNDSPALEAMADAAFSRPQPLAAPLRRPNVIQCAGRVAISLIPTANRTVTYGAGELTVDKLTLAERFDTGLTFGTQGDHIVADVLVKKEQKAFAKGRTVDQILDFYHSRLEDNVNAVKFAWGKILEGLSQAQSSPAAVPFLYRDQVNAMLQHRAALGSYVIPPGTRSGGLDYFKYPGSKLKRFKLSRYLSEQAKEKIEQISSQRVTMLEWNVFLREMISTYNRAYAHSPFATVGGWSGGHSEGQAMAYLRDVRHDETGGKTYSTKLEAFLDDGAMNRVNMGFVFLDSATYGEMVDEVYPHLKAGSWMQARFQDIKKAWQTAPAMDVPYSVRHYLIAAYTALTSTSDVAAERRDAKQTYRIDDPETDDLNDMQMQG